MKLLATINKIDDWAKKWRIKIIERKSTHITFTLCNRTCPTVPMGNVDLSQKSEMKYLGMHFDRSLTWAKHNKTNRQQLTLKAKQVHWLLGRRSTLSIVCKCLLYKAVLKPIWIYGNHLWVNSFQFQY
jgi:hypothetical protein